MFPKRFTLSQIFWGLITLLNLWLLIKGSKDWYLLFFFFQWVWLSLMAIKSLAYNSKNKYGSILTVSNIVISVSILLFDVVILFLSISFGARLIFASLNIYGICLYGTTLIFFLSILAHIYIILKNITIAEEKKNILSLTASLLFYPIGVWTIQGKLKKQTPKP